MKNIVLYHASCADGMTAAWVASLWMTPDGSHCENAEYYPVSYGGQIPDVRGACVYILDFSFKASVLREIAEAAEKMTLIDHHKTAEKEIADFVKNLPEELRSKVTVVFDVKHSGAMLTWTYFNPTARIPAIIQYVEDRDLWSWKLPYSKEVSAYIRSFPYTLEAYQKIAVELGYGAIDSKSHVIKTGEAILRYEDNIVDKMIGNAVTVQIAGHDVKMVNSSHLQSEIGEKLAIDNGKMGVCWHIRKDGMTEFSLRSRSDFDVSEVAKMFGGGGHRQAAGFQCNLPVPFQSDPNKSPTPEELVHADVIASHAIAQPEPIRNSSLALMGVLDPHLHKLVQASLERLHAAH